MSIEEGFIKNIFLFIIWGFIIFIILDIINPLRMRNKIFKRLNAMSPEELEKEVAKDARRLKWRDINYKIAIGGCALLLIYKLLSKLFF